MTEFKEGDKIVVSDDNDYHTNLNGKSGIIKTIDSTNRPYFISFDDGSDGWVAKVRFPTDKPKKLKIPTHIVVWNEESKDPCKFYTSLEEANDFIKELSKKTSVKEDSIVLVEIKSAKKITIQKSLRKSDYKI